MPTSSQLGVHAIGVAATVAWLAFANIIIFLITTAVVGLRTTDDEMAEGLDLSYHGERGYNF